jgi:Protein of unknown function (DUF3800)
MDLSPNGIDVFYVDESERHPLALASAIRIPFLKPKQGGWEFVWDSYADAATKWRRNLSSAHSIRFREELHGYRILKHQGLYHKSGRNLTPSEATTLYKDALATLTWLPDKSIMSAYATERSSLMGHEGISACLFGLFQRIRNQCYQNNVNGMLCFDEGHTSRIRLYRMAQKYLPTGSRFGAWESGKLTKNLPLTMFPVDGEMKHSDLSYFIRIADLVCYAARLKIEHERTTLRAKRVARDHHVVYHSIPRSKLNLAATMKRRDAIVPT